MTFSEDFVITRHESFVTMRCDHEVFFGYTLYRRQSGNIPKIYGKQFETN